MAPGDVSFYVLYNGPTDAVAIAAATKSGAESGVANTNKQIIAIPDSNGHVKIIQVLIAST
jgi:hypothetical protein